MAGPTGAGVPANAVNPAILMDTNMVLQTFGSASTATPKVDRTPELGFRALLLGDGAEWLELTRT
jgi:hypothetical protein